MTASTQSQAIKANRLLALLPQPEYARLLPELKPVYLKKGAVLYHAGDAVQYCYFPVSGIISLLSTAAAEGKTVEVGMVGNEGMIGVSVLLQMSVIPYDAVAQIEVEALQIDASVLKAEFNRGGTLNTVLLRYIYALLRQISQSAVCHHFHTVEQRLACWLLMMRDRLQSNAFPLTQEFLAYMLGIPRTNVTMTAGALQQAGLISCRRGEIAITDEKGLEETACDCYKVIKEATDEILK
jgi:CRP-like cAMP-binding protein